MATAATLIYCAAARRIPVACSVARARQPWIMRQMSTAASQVAVPAALVKQLRELTGAPMVDCKAALQAENNSIDKAVDFLRKKGLATASKKAGRTAAQGLVAINVAADCRKAAIIELNSETDFVARNSNFQSLASRISSVALGSLPASTLTLSSGVGQERASEQASSVAGMDLPGGDSLGKPCTVGAGVTDLVAKIRENMLLRRAASLALPTGLVVGYTHNAVGPGLGSIGVLLGLLPKHEGKGALPVDNAALNELAKKIAMHIAAAKPLYCVKSDVPAREVEREKAVLMEQSAKSGKPPAIVAKMVEGKLGKFYGETVLESQPFILSEEGVGVGKLLESGSAAALAGSQPGQSARLAGFVHFVVGEGAPKGKEE